MINNDVQLFWANNENGEITIIYDMQEEDRNNKYTCPVCGSDVKPVAIGGKRKDGEVAQVSSHFSHFDASKCKTESAIHWWFKNKILINGDSFIVKTDVEHEYKCKEVLIEQSYETGYGIYSPDITILTECGNIVYFEMNYTNKKKVEDYLDKWLELGNSVVEVDLKMLMEASFNKDTYKFKALFYEGKCFGVKKSDLYYNSIGRHKENILKGKYTPFQKDELEKLDWFWKDIVKYKQGELDISEIYYLIKHIQHEDSKKIIVDILKNTNCQEIIKDYVENYKSEVRKTLGLMNLNYDGFEIKYRIITPHKIYDRLFYAYLIEFYTNNKIIIYSCYFSDIKKSSNIIDKYNLSLLKFEKALDYMKQYSINPIYTTQLDSFKYPSLRYYYSNSYNEHRIYFNNFKNHRNDYYVKLSDYATDDDLLNYIEKEVELNNSFIEEEIIEINIMTNKLKEEFSIDEFDISTKVENGCRLCIDIIYNDIYYSVCNEYRGKYRDEGNIPKYEVIANKVAFKIEDILYEKGLKDLLKYLNNQYKKVKNNWSFSLHKDNRKKDDTSILICNQNYKYITYEDMGSKHISNYKYNIITYEELKKILTKEVSDFIRNCIYKGGK